MVNTIVRFENHRFSPFSTSPSVNIQNKEKQSYLKEHLYLIIGICLLIIICLPNIFSIIHAYENFPYHILFLFHSSFLILFLISMAFFPNNGNCLTTILCLILLGIYKIIHYLIRYRYCRMNFRRDFLFSTIQLIGLFTFIIISILWSYLLIRKKSISSIEYHLKQKRIFYSFLMLNLMLTISTLILNIRSPEYFNLYDILILSIGISLALVWFIFGILMSIYPNCLCISLYYLLSLIQPVHIIYMIVQSINKITMITNETEMNEYFSLFIISFVCISMNMLVHLITSLTACWMLTKTEKMICNTRWMLTSNFKI